MSSINFNIRMDENLKARAFPIIESYGLTPAQAVKLFFHQIADTHTLPLSFQHKALSTENKIPNAVTIAAIEELRAGLATMESYKTVEEAIAAMAELAREQ